MKTILKKYTWLILPAGILGFLFVMQALSDNNYSADPHKLVTRLSDPDIYISPQTENRKNYFTILIEGEKDEVNTGNYDIGVAFDSLLMPDAELIFSKPGKKLLISSDPSLSAGAWVLLNARGVKDLYLEKTDSEEIHHSFRPKQSE